MLIVVIPGGCDKGGLPFMLYISVLLEFSHYFCNKKTYRYKNKYIQRMNRFEGVVLVGKASD